MAHNTFAIIVSGRLVQTEFEQVEENKFVTTIPNADNINHIVVFMTGAVPLQDGLAAAVYFSFPDPAAPPMWIFLGYICNQKPSAIFKITKLKQLTANCIVQQNAGMNFALAQPQVSHFAQIGISIEPQNTVLQMATDPSVSTDSNNLNKFEEFGSRIAENMFNYCSSFANNAVFFANNSPGNTQLVPLTSINDWYQRFLRNFKTNPNFWRQ